MPPLQNIYVFSSLLLNPNQSTHLNTNECKVNRTLAVEQWVFQRGNFVTTKM